jgi:predicted Zn-dependent protease
LIRNSEFHRAAQLLISELGRGQVPGQARFALGLADLRLPLLPDEVDPSRSTLIQEVGDAAALLAANKPDEGLQALAQTVKNHPDTPFLHYFYATALASQQRYEDSDAQLREETRVSPQSELAYLQLARNALWSRRYADALSASQHAVERAPQYGEAHYLLGRSLLELGKSEEAIKELKNANGIAPNSPGVHFSLARAYAKTKQPEKAGQERGIFERLNAIVERQRSQQGGQAYGDAHHRSGLANPGKAPGDGTTPDQR